jgi:glycosyltransferase involved in cell wall biosynthesis
VFTSKYPARVATFFERDMRALLQAGVEIEVLPIYPLDSTLWRYSLELLSEAQLPRHRVHHLGLLDSVQRALPTVRGHAAACSRDAVSVLASAARYGPIPLAKTAYVLPKAWAWHAELAGRFDHVLAYWGNYAGTCAFAFHRLLGRRIPLSIWLHAGTDLYRDQVFLRQKLAYADNVITCCEFNRAYLLDRFPRLRPELDRRIHVSHHGLDMSTFPYRPEGRPPNHVIAVGRLAAHKGFDYLLHAVGLLYSRGVDVTVELVGDGPQRGELRQLASDLGIAERVRFRGWLPFPDTRQAMSEATLLVHPSDGLGDGLPNVVREAMALGTPVIASRVAGIPDALRDGCGVLVPPRNVVALADAITQLVRDPAARLGMAARARARAERHYDLWQNGKRLAAILRGTCRRDAGSDGRNAQTPPPGGA